MIFSVSNEGIQWTLDFAPDSVTIAVVDLDQNLTITSQEIPLAAGHLLFSQRQDCLDNHLPRVPIIQSQEGTMEIRDEVLSSVGARDLDTSSYQVSDLEGIEINGENSQLDMDAVFRPGIDTPFSPTTMEDLSMKGSVENPIVLDEEEDNEKAPHPTTPESVGPTEPLRLERSRAFGARIENVADHVFGNFFQYVLPCLIFIIHYNYCVIFYHNIFQKLVGHVRDKSGCRIDISSSTSFCIYQAHTENKVGHHSKIKIQSACGNEHKKYCLYGGECFYLFDEDIVGGKC